MPNQMNPMLITPLSSQDFDNANMVVWSEWSQWSSCVDKNGVCDPSRLHSRLRKCVSQHTGEKVDVSHCKSRFNMHDLALELDDCSKSCSQQQQQQPSDSHIMSDAPSVIATAPSVFGNNNESPSPMMPSFTQTNSNNKPKMSAITAASSKDSNSNSGGSLVDVYTPSNSLAPTGSSEVNLSAQSSSTLGTSSLVVNQAITTEGARSGTVSAEPNSVISSTLMPQLVDQPAHVDLNNQQQQLSQMSCSNCTSDEICLLLMQQKVPFCAKMKNRSDESGCFGWCKAQNQLCQPVGQNAFKCIHDSECLAEEWRCNDSACIPLSKRCDGHSNCYDNSDERDCPAIRKQIID